MKRVIKAEKDSAGLELMWVGGYGGVEDNKRTDARAKMAVFEGRWLLEPSLATPAGLRSAYPLFGGREKYHSWDRDAMRGLMYLYTDRGPMRG